VAWLTLVLAVVAGVGWLYELRTWRVLGLGPAVPGALPLQQLAGDDAQPLLRVVVAWVPAGALAGWALAGTLRARPTRALATALAGWALLILAGAVSDAAAISDPVLTHLAPQLHRPGTWVAVALLLTGALLSPRAGRERRARAARAASSGR
jgi:hypothetical protein